MACTACAGGFHGGVRRQDVGLKSNAVDDANDVPDAAGRGMDFLHGGHHPAHHLATMLGHTAGIQCELARLLGVGGVLLDCGVELLHGGGSLPQGTGLLFGAAGQVVAAAGDLVCSAGHALATLVDGAHRVGQLLLHLCHGMQHLGRFVASLYDHRVAEIALGHGLRCTDGLPQGLRNASHQRQRKPCRQQQAADDGAQCQIAHQRVAFHGVRISLLARLGLPLHQRFDACPYGLIQWPHLLHHQGLCQGHIARTQCRHRGQQALLDKARAVGEEVLGQARFVFGVGARFIGLPISR